MNENFFSDLVNAISDRANEVSVSRNVEISRPSLIELFDAALKRSSREVRKGAPVADFADSTVINLIFAGVEAGYSADELREFILQLKSSEIEELDA